MSISSKAIIFDSALTAYLLAIFAIVLVQPTQEQMLNLSFNSALLVVFAVLGIVLSLMLNKTGVPTLGGYIFAPPHEKNSGEVKSWFRTFWGWELIVGFIVTFVVGLQVTGFSLIELFDEQGFDGAQRVFGALISPNFDILGKGIIAIIQTVYIAFLATVIAIPVAFLLAFFAAKNIMGATPIGLAFYFLLRALLNITRSIEPLIWAIIFSVWVGIGPFAGMLALMLHSVASLTKQYSEMIEAVSEGPIEGIQATGANPVQVIWFAIVPQIILPYISFTIYRWDINVRMATIIGLVGGGGIGTMLIQYQGQAMWNEVGCLALLIVAVVWLMDTASAYLREALK